MAWIRHSDLANVPHLSKLWKRHIPLFVSLVSCLVVMQYSQHESYPERLLSSNFVYANAQHLPMSAREAIRLSINSRLKGNPPVTWGLNIPRQNFIDIWNIYGNKADANTSTVTTGTSLAKTTAAGTSSAKSSITTSTRSTTTSTSKRAVTSTSTTNRSTTNTSTSTRSTTTRSTALSTSSPSTTTKRTTTTASSTNRRQSTSAATLITATNRNPLWVPDMSKMHCDPLPFFKKCVNGCQELVETQDTNDGTSLGQWSYISLKKCYVNCEKKWIDAPTPGCLGKDGVIVPPTGSAGDEPDAGPSMFDRWSRRWSRWYFDLSGNALVRALVLTSLVILIFLTVAASVIICIYYKAYLLISALVRRSSRELPEQELLTSGEYRSRHWTDEASERICFLLQGGGLPAVVTRFHSTTQQPSRSQHFQRLNVETQEDTQTTVADYEMKQFDADVEDGPL